MLGTFGPLQSWFPAVTACSLGTSSPQRLPPFSGHRTAELRAELRGRGLGVSHAPSTTPSIGRRTTLWEGQVPPRTRPSASCLAPPSPYLSVSRDRKATLPTHPSASPCPAPTPAASTVPAATGKDHAPPPRPVPLPQTSSVHLKLWGTSERPRTYQALSPTYNPCSSTPERGRGI